SLGSRMKGYLLFSENKTWLINAISSLLKVPFLCYCIGAMTWIEQDIACLMQSLGKL
ncbi:hypothetical protein ACJX0J_036593, partial [Zea mays]